MRSAAAAAMKLMDRISLTSTSREITSFKRDLKLSDLIGRYTKAYRMSLQGDSELSLSQELPLTKSARFRISLITRRLVKNGNVCLKRV